MSAALHECALAFVVTASAFDEAFAARSWRAGAANRLSRGRVFALEVLLAGRHCDGWYVLSELIGGVFDSNGLDYLGMWLPS